MSKSWMSKKHGVNSTLLTCPYCNSKGCGLTDFGKRGLCGNCRKTWLVLDSFMTH